MLDTIGAVRLQQKGFRRNMAAPTNLFYPSEELIACTRQHVLVPISRFVSGLALITLLVAAGLAARAFHEQRVFFLPASQFILGSTTFISMLLAINLIWEYLRWRAEQYILTDQRILIANSWRQTVEALPLDQIRHVALHQNALGRVVNFGHLTVQLQQPDRSHTLEYMPHPWSLLQRVQEASHQVRQGYGYLASLPTSELPLGTVQDEVQHSLAELARLRDRGILSWDEFEARKRELLSRN